MRQTLLLLVLTLAMYSVNVNVNAQTKKPVRKTAQTKPKTQSSPKDSREYQVENDGFEWYRICKNGKYGAEDRNGTTLVPCEYSLVSYLRRHPVEKDFGGFLVKKGEYVGWYNEYGKYIIPYTRHYIDISKSTDDNFGTYFLCKSSNASYAIHGLDGNIVKSFDLDSSINYIWVHPQWCNNRFYYFIQSEDLWFGIADGNGKIVIKPTKGYNLLYVNDDIYAHTNAGKIIIGNSSLIETTINPLANNSKEGVSSSNSTAYSNTGSNSNNNQGGGTTTVVVEHQYTPQPVQEWQACFGCGGMGTMGCDNCGGSGTKYIGDRLHRCSRCNGQGIIPCNICYGSKGKYVTIYR